MVRDFLCRLSRSPLVERSALGIAQRVAAAPGVLSVLTYHRVEPNGPHAKGYPGLVSTTPDAFRRQIQSLRSVASIVSMRQVLDVVAGRGRLPPKAVLLTFDDATPDFARYAWPILRSLRIPVTLFVPTAYPDAPARTFWWDRLYHLLQEARTDELATPWGRLPLTSPRQKTKAYRRLRRVVRQLDHAEALQWIEKWQNQVGTPHAPQGPSVLSWDDLRQLQNEGVAIAPHTRTHPLLDRMATEEATEEILGSVHDMRRELGDFTPVFAYPGGGVTAEVRAVVESTGIEAAFTTVRGTNDLATADRYRLQRINVGPRSTTALILAQLAWYWSRRTSASSES